MVISELVARQVAGVAGVEKIFCPFNVYGDFAVSRSIVRGGKPDLRPLPHLSVSIEVEIVESFSRLFDAIWDRSVDFKAKVLDEMDPEHKKMLGTGKLFDLWSSLG